MWLLKFFQIVFFSVRSKIKGTWKKSFNLICFELKQQIEDFMFSLSKSNCKLMWTPQLPSLRCRSGSSNGLTSNSPLIFGMWKSTWLFIIISWLRIFSMTHTPSVQDYFSDSGTAELRRCSCDESRWVFVCLLAVNVFLLFISIALSTLILSSTINVSWCYFFDDSHLAFFYRDDTSDLVPVQLIVFKHWLVTLGMQDCIAA